MDVAAAGDIALGTEVYTHRFPKVAKYAADMLFGI
jgi:hypothetical protein